MKREARYLLMLALTLIVGCGKAEYDQRMQSKLQQLQFGTAFLENLQPKRTIVLQNVATFQLPAVIDEDATIFDKGPNSKDVRGDPISPKRMNPPFGEVPGFRYCYEKSVRLEGNDEQPLYCYVGVVDANQKNSAALLGELKRDVGKSFRGAVWQDANLDTPTGGKIAWKKMSVKGQQVFEATGGQSSTLPGQLDLYVHSTPAHHFVIAFRSPDSVASEVDLFRVAELSLGSFEARDPGPGAANG